jgi:hypothetical protein
MSYHESGFLRPLQRVRIVDLIRKIHDCELSTLADNVTDERLVLTPSESRAWESIVLDVTRTTGGCRAENFEQWVAIRAREQDMSPAEILRRELV